MEVADDTDTPDQAHWPSTMLYHNHQGALLFKELSADESAPESGDAVSSDVAYSSTIRVSAEGPSPLLYGKKSYMENAGQDTEPSASCTLIDSHNVSCNSPRTNTFIVDKSIESYDSRERVTVESRPHHVSAEREQTSRGIERLGSGFSGISYTFGVSHSGGDSENSRRLTGTAESTKHSVQYKGVVPQPNGRWGAQIYDRNQRVWLGTFNTEDEAAKAYDRAAWKYRGRDAVVNFNALDYNQAEKIFLKSLSKEQVVDMLRRHTFEEQLELSKIQRIRWSGSGGDCNINSGPERKSLKDEVLLQRTQGPNMNLNGHSHGGLPPNSLGFHQRASGSSNPSSCTSPPSRQAALVMEREHLFDKCLTPSDVGKLNRLVIPKQHAERCFPLGNNNNAKGMMLNLEDSSGKRWRFRYSYWASSQSYVFTKGWSGFVKEKKLSAGDIVSFERSVSNSSELFISCRHRPPPVQPSLARQEFSFHNQQMATARSSNFQAPISFPFGSMAHAGGAEYPPGNEELRSSSSLPNSSISREAHSPCLQGPNEAAPSVPVGLSLGSSSKQMKSKSGVSIPFKNDQADICELPLLDSATIEAIPLRHFNTKTLEHRSVGEAFSLPPVGDASMALMTIRRPGISISEQKLFRDDHISQSHSRSTEGDSMVCRTKLFHDKECNGSSTTKSSTTGLRLFGVNVKTPMPSANGEDINRKRAVPVDSSSWSSGENYRKRFSRQSDDV
ncbi:hypothetical protein KP509_22G022700 [Ceratopteris richardii]|uniref:Uncharacterized protein n=2 Tax=Ceratopteris richardii TaxID=49495 RepID=A0A8T2S5C3_CERRI|nr:hypothetical protein KP509_22G022700 [Ceratopteris richardii]